MQAGPPRPGDGEEVHHYLSVIRRRKWSILLVTILTVGSALFFSFRQTPIYNSTARVQVKPLDAGQALQGSDSTFFVSMETEQALVAGQDVAVAARAIDQAGGGSGRETGGVSTSIPVETTLMDITYADPDPAAAQRWANAYAQAYIQDRQTRALTAYEEASRGYAEKADVLQEQIDDKQRELRGASKEEEKELRGDIADLEQQQSIVNTAITQLPPPSQDPASVIAPAMLPSTPSSPNVLLNGFLALAVGLGLGLVFAFLRERMDHRLAGREDLEEQIEAPTLAVVPKVRGWRKRDKTKLSARDAPTSPPAEAYRTIRTNLQFAGRDKDLRVLTITSANLGEGKTTTAANLAVTLAQTGKRVIAVSCDLRRPRLHRFFGIDNNVGVTSLLTGDVTLPQAAQRVGIDSLRVIASGPVPPNPAELLASDAMDSLIRDLRQNADYVILDTPPVLAVSDALQIAPRSDGVIVVADADATTRAGAALMREQLGQVGCNVIGGIYNNFDRSNAKYAPGQYRYYYTYQYANNPANGDRRSRASGNGNGNGRTPKPVEERAAIWHP